MDPVAKSGMLFGVISMVVLGVMSMIPLAGCCVPFGVIAIGAICGGLVAKESLKSATPGMIPPGPGIPEPVPATAGPEPVKDAAKATAIAGLFCFVGQFFGAIAAMLLFGQKQMEQMEEAFAELSNAGMDVPSFLEEMGQGGMLGISAISGACCGAFYFALMVGCGVLTAFIVAKTKK